MKEQWAVDSGQWTTKPPFRWRGFVGAAVILVAAVVAVAPLVLRGDSCGHDFDFHLVSWFDALSSWRHGIVYPHWTASANYGAGEPRFVFYSPLTWMMGAALGAVLPWTLVPVVLTYLLLAGTGLAVRALGREVLEDGAATLAGCVASGRRLRSWLAGCGFRWCCCMRWHPGEQEAWQGASTCAGAMCAP